MNAEAASLGAALTERFLLDFPREASREIEALPLEDAASMLAAQPARAVLRTWECSHPTSPQPCSACCPSSSRVTC